MSLLGQNCKIHLGTFIWRKVISVIVYLSLFHELLKTFENTKKIVCKNVYGELLKIFMWISTNKNIQVTHADDLNGFCSTIHQQVKASWTEVC